jgi:hypothetical protein
VRLLIWLQLIQRLKHCLHQLVVVGIVGLVVDSLTIAVVVPCVHHLRDFYKRYINFTIESKPQTI